MKQPNRHLQQMCSISGGGHFTHLLRSVHVRC
jgi:hypothetical protein